MNLRSFLSARWVILFLLSFFFCSEAYPVWAFKVLKTSGGTEIKWHSTETVPYKINTSRGPSGSLAAIQNAMNTWSNVSDCCFGFQYSGTSNSHSHGENDGVNMIDFGPIDEISTVAENYLWFNSSSGALVDSDIRFNTNHTFSTTGSSSAFDIQSTITHEFGHSLALADLYNSSDSEKTMYGIVEEGETKKRSLHQDDINGIRYLYPTETTAPTLTITSHSDGEHVSTSSIELEGTASDSGKGDNGIYHVTVNGQPANNDTADGDHTADWNISLTLSEGANSITVIAQDNSCNHNEKTITITLYYDPGDKVEPDTFMTSGPSGTITYRNVTFTFTGSDDITETSRLSYSYKLEGYQNSWTGYAFSTSANYTRLASGTYTFFVRAKDEAGNVDSSPASRTFTVDYVLPFPTGVSASDGTYNDRVQVSWNAVNDAYAYEVWRNVNSNENTATQLSSNVSGTHYNDYSATPGQIYYYWVKSRTYGLIISDFSQYDTGWLTSTAPVTSIEISGPSAVNENTGYQYSCFAHYQAGNTADVTEDTTWREDCRSASISDSGYLISGFVRSDQTCSISAVYSGQTSSHSIVIKNVTDDDINSIVPLIILLLGQDSND